MRNSKEIETLKTRVTKIENSNETLDRKRGDNTSHVNIDGLRNELTLQL